MKIIRYFNSQGVIEYGAVTADGSSNRIEGDIFGVHHVTGDVADVAKLLAPIEPTAILCIGLNYREHAKEGGMPIPSFPILFCKGVNTLQNPGDPIEIPTAAASHEVDYECELAVVIGKACKNVSKETALDYVLGYTCANDVSARDWQLKWGGGQWCRGKFFDTFCPLGPTLVTPQTIKNPNALAIKTEVNGEVVQNLNTNDMIFSVAELISFLSGSSTLLPGTVILTGTPQGVGMARKPQLFLKAGDTVTIEIETIGRLTNSVTLEKV
jgi:2-keto-4-pentenoate hydratase/2-oxohepta-3-ene-1,7-dioic acid hydratase in catechol pathway